MKKVISRKKDIICMMSKNKKYNPLFYNKLDIFYSIIIFIFEKCSNSVLQNFASYTVYTTDLSPQF
mgnify:CR=1 FL=1